MIRAPFPPRASAKDGHRGARECAIRRTPDREKRQPEMEIRWLCLLGVRFPQEIHCTPVTLF
jgi:hypothetical protein